MEGFCKSDHICMYHKLLLAAVCTCTGGNFVAKFFVFCYLKNLGKCFCSSCQLCLLISHTCIRRATYASDRLVSQIGTLYFTGCYHLHHDHLVSYNAYMPFLFYDKQSVEGAS